MLRRLTEFFVRVAQRYVPDPFLFALLLTLLTLVLARAATPHPLIALIGFWHDGLWKILTFAMQMILILLTGYTLAASRPVERALVWIASKPRTPGQAAVLVTVAALAASLLNWGFGLVAGALLAREVGRRVRIDFPFLVACAYSGFVLWHSGLSGSIPLVSASEGNPMNLIARHGGAAATPVTQTIFAPFNLALVAGMMVLLPLLLRGIMPSPRRSHPLETAGEAPPPALWPPQTPAERLENSPVLTLLLCSLLAAYLARHFATRGFDLNLEVLILVFLGAGLLCHWRPIAYVRAFTESGRLAGPLVLQYPLYGGIMGLMVDSGLAAWISNAFVAVATPRTLPLFTYYAACLVNMFIPSGGGQWAVQGPIMLPAGMHLGVAPPVTAMAVAFGDQTTNMLQPFWALPVLSIAGVGIREVMGYCVMTCLLSLLLSSLVLLLLA